MKKQGALVSLITLLLLVRVVYYFAQPDLSTDHLSQMAMTQNYMDGHGFSFKYLNDQAEVFYSTHIQWPPLYPFLLALVSFITSNTLLSSFIIQISVLLFIAITWKKIFKLFEPLISEEAFLYFTSLLIISTSILNNINTILVFAILLLSISLYFTFAYLFLDKSKKLNLILSALFASFLFWTHYSYFFVAFYPAVVFFILFYLRKNKSYLFAGFTSFLISLVITSGVLIYNFISTGLINYMDNPTLWDAGFFPEHLLLTDPFFLNAFIKTAYFLDYLFTNNQQIIISFTFQILSFLILTLIIFLFLRLRGNKNILFEKTSQIFIPFFVIIVLTIFFLLYFTLHYHEIPRPGWTHIGDPRYLSAVYLSILAIVVMLIFIKTDYINKKIIQAAKAIMISLVFTNVAINIYITVDHWGKYSFETDSYVAPYDDLRELFDNIKLDISNGNQPVFIDNDLTVRSFRISQYAGAAVIDSDEVIGIEDFQVNMVFFFILPLQEQYRDEDYLMLEWSEKFHVQIIGQAYNGLNLYKVNNL